MCATWVNECADCSCPTNRSAIIEGTHHRTCFDEFGGRTCWLELTRIILTWIPYLLSMSILLMTCYSKGLRLRRVAYVNLTMSKFVWRVSSFSGHFKVSLLDWIREIRSWAFRRKPRRRSRKIIVRKQNSRCFQAIPTFRRISLNGTQRMAPYNGIHGDEFRPKQSCARKFSTLEIG